VSHRGGVRLLSTKFGQSMRFALYTGRLPLQTGHLASFSVLGNRMVETLMSLPVRAATNLWKSYLVTVLLMKQPVAKSSTGISRNVGQS